MQARNGLTDGLPVARCEPARQHAFAQALCIGYSAGDQRAGIGESMPRQACGDGARDGQAQCVQPCRNSELSPGAAQRQTAMPVVITNELAGQPATAIASQHPCMGLRADEPRRTAASAHRCAGRLLQPIIGVEAGGRRFGQQGWVI